VTTSDTGASHPILIIDDEDQMRDVLIVACEILGQAAIGVSSADEALAQLRAGLRPALILFDLVMPYKSGWEFRAEQLADPELADIPSVAMSAAMRGESMRRNLQVEALLPKPIDLDLLLALVTRYSPGTTNLGSYPNAPRSDPALCPAPPARAETAPLARPLPRA
jgi:CheY-like chemotaxis protein